MSFTITITETTTKASLTGRQWLQIGTQDNGEPDFGYTPQVECIKEVDTKRLEQTVENLDLPAVIRAINGL